jgi:hypothetical protein
MGDSSFWNITFPRVLSTYAVVVIAVMWLGFVIALLVNPEWLDMLWEWVRALPILLQIIVWVIFLPVMVGLWAWESSWSVFVKLLVLAGLVGWTILAVSSFTRAWR